jgi:hypothetical protein
MNTIKIVTILLSTILLVSCRVEINPAINCDYSFEFDRCRCRCYSLPDLKSISDLSCKWPNGEAFTSGNYPADKCEGLVGFLSDDVATEIMPKLKYYKRKYKW